MYWELFNLQHMRKCGNFSVFIALAFYWFHCAKYSNLRFQSLIGLTPERKVDYFYSI